MVDQLGLPLLRAPAVRRRGRVDERLLARAPEPRRGLASQPPRLPAVGGPRARAARARPLGLGHLGDGEARAGLERRPDHPGAPAFEAGVAGSR